MLCRLPAPQNSRALHGCARFPGHGSSGMAFSAAYRLREKCSLLHFQPVGNGSLHPHCPQAYPQPDSSPALDFRHFPELIHIFHRFSTSVFHSLSPGGCVFFTAFFVGFRRGFVFLFSQPVELYSRICMNPGPVIVRCGSHSPLERHGSSIGRQSCRTSVKIIRRKSYPQA